MLTALAIYILGFSVTAWLVAEGSTQRRKNGLRVISFRHALVWCLVWPVLIAGGLRTLRRHP